MLGIFMRVTFMYWQKCISVFATLWSVFQNSHNLAISVTRKLDLLFLVPLVQIYGNTWTLPNNSSEILGTPDQKFLISLEIFYHPAHCFKSVHCLTEG